MKKIYAFSLLVIVAFALRALVFWGYLGDENRYWQVDSATYETLAKELAINERFATPDGTPNAYRLPGYPLFLAMIFKAVGVNHHAALWVQIILASLIPLLVFFLAQVLFPRRRRIALPRAAGGARGTGWRRPTAARRRRPGPSPSAPAARRG